MQTLFRASNALKSLQMPLLLHCLYDNMQRNRKSQNGHQTHISVPRGLVHSLIS
ncbi:hypothetical protein J3F84DRAFT_366976 [Trichoderma pleuroticola]